MGSRNKVGFPHFLFLNAISPLANVQYYPPKNNNIITFLKYNAEIVVRQRYNCYFCTMKVMFQPMKHTFQPMKRTFQLMKRTFQPLEQQIECG